MTSKTKPPGVSCRLMQKRNQYIILTLLLNLAEKYCSFLQLQPVCQCWSLHCRGDCRLGFCCLPSHTLRALWLSALVISV